jgi:hypothetical protein
MAQLPPAPGERVQPLAITGGQPPSGQVPSPRQPLREAQDIANDAANATTREDIEALSGEMKERQFEKDYIYPDLNPDGVHDELQGYLRARWKALPASGGKGS